jgi:hypothetical protein
MFKRVDKVLIGKDITRTATLTGFPHATANNLADGEVLVLDKNYMIMTAGQTIADTDTIYICQGTATTFAYSQSGGTAVTAARKIIISDAIEGALVKSFKGVSYDAKGEQVTTFTTTACTPLTAGTEIVLRIVYKDITEHPGQFTQTYRYVVTTAAAGTIDTIVAAIAAVVNAHDGRRVNATVNAGNDYLILTGRVIPECTTALSDIDKFSQVRFNAFLSYVNTDGNWVDWGATEVVAVVQADHGQGTWEQVRDMEKSMRPNMGLDNITHFPVKSPDPYTVSAETYDLIVIESDKSYTSADNQYVKRQPLTTVIAIPNNAAGPASNQVGDILAVLNPWMASCPGAFVNVTV